MDTYATHGPDFGASLLRHLGKVLADPSTLHAFKHWFTTARWEAESGNDDVPDDILDLAYRIENLIGIHDAGFWSIERLIAEIRSDLKASPIAAQTARQPPVVIVFGEADAAPYWRVETDSSVRPGVSAVRIGSPSFIAGPTSAGSAVGWLRVADLCATVPTGPVRPQTLWAFG